MKKAHRPRSPFLLWWNDEAAVYASASRYELARLAWQEATRQAAARRRARASRSKSEGR